MRTLTRRELRKYNYLEIFISIASTVYRTSNKFFQSTKKIGKLMFDSMDINKDGFVSKDEMVEFGKVMVSNNTEYLDFWVQGNFKNDENEDELLTFEEFYKPQIRMGTKPVHDEF